MSKSEPLICQIAKPDVYLPCKEEIDGLRCERLERHFDDHWLGEHTILHRIAGEDKSCAEVDGLDEEPEIAVPIKQPKAPTKPLTGLKLAGLLVSAVATAVVLALLVQFGLPGGGPDAVTAKDGDLRPINIELAAFTGQTIASANVEQKALATGDEATTPPAFIFSNGEKSPNRRDFHLYLDFGDQESRSLFLLNSTLLKSLVEGGKIDLYIHPVPNGEAYSILAPETLAETMYFEPDRAWQAMGAIMKFADEYQRENYKVEKLAKRLAETVNKLGVSQVDKESIQNGTFSSWLLSIGSDPRLGMGTHVPAAYLGDKEIDLSNLDLSTNRPLLDGLEPN